MEMQPTFRNSPQMAPLQNQINSQQQINFQQSNLMYPQHSSQMNFQRSNQMNFQQPNQMRFQQPNQMNFQANQMNFRQQPQPNSMNFQSSTNPHFIQKNFPHQQRPIGIPMQNVT